MTIRRPDRTGETADDLDLSAASDDEGPLDNPFRQLDSTVKVESLIDELLVHPSSTDFGPKTLARFIREEIDKAKMEGKLGKGKGKATQTANAPCSEGPIDNLKPRNRTTVAYADNALRHLRGLPDTYKREPMSSHQPRRSTQPVSRLASSPSKRSTASMDKLSYAESRHAKRRSMDFEDYAESVRNRNRSAIRRTSYRDPAGHHQPDDPDDSDESPPRPRKTGESLSHLVKPRPTTPEPEHLATSPIPRIARTPGEMRAMLTASSQLSISDAEVDDAAEIPDLLPESGNLHSIPDFFGSSEDSSSDSDDPRPSTAEGRTDQLDRLLERAMRDELSDVRRDKMCSAARRLSTCTTSAPSSFDYAACIPSATPRFVSSSTSVSNTTPTTPQKSSKPPQTRRQRAASTEGQDLDDQDYFPTSRKLAHLDKSIKPKRTKKIAMVFDSSKPAWCVGNPLSDVGKLGDNPPDSGPGDQILTLPGFNYDIWVAVAEYLSSEDLHRLRLVNSTFARELAPILLRSVVTCFGRTMFHLGGWNARGVAPPSQSMLAKYGKEIHKFGISFDYDPMGLAFAKAKVFTRQETAWYGSYRWPLEMYPRFSQLQELEDLVDDNRPLLKDAFANLQSVSEFALSLDSGHGWLEGPDISDLALFEARRSKGTKVFGQNFAEDIWHTYGRNEYFKWAQQNSINASKKLMGSNKADTWGVRQKIKEFSRMVIRDYDSFRDETTQPDFDPHSHTGGQVSAGQVGQQAQQHAAQFAAVQNVAGVFQVQANVQFNVAQTPAQRGFGPPGRRMSRHIRQAPATSSKSSSQSQLTPIPLQYPLIFNCHNVAADVGGRQLMNKTADPSHHPLIPGHLTEAQAQWLMETAWAQRAFLSAYTTSIITHKLTLRKVHTLTIAKMSSGLLPSLAQREFWTSLSGLKRLKILVKPDWRNEHIPGDKFYASNMPVNPCIAAGKFADFLEQNIARLENLSHLTVGYVGGGEHATGMFARNQHVLPAPITNNPRKWISDHDKKPDPMSLFAFSHIRDLRFENCWFSPCMLETFMEKSRDTSLHTLALDSVSMLSRHSTGIDGPMSTLRNALRCAHDADNWLAEIIPASAVWTDVLDKITPGATMLERKHRAGMVDADFDPLPEREFRGNISKIVLKSCGYAKISGVEGDQFNQNALVVQMTSGHMVPIPPAQVNGQQNGVPSVWGGTACDGGLQARRARFDKVDLRFLEENLVTEVSNGDGGAYTAAGGDGGVNGRRRSRLASGVNGGREGAVMMSRTAPDGSDYFGLGTLTQCVHPIEKRVLEKAWGMKFGWGNDMKRWSAVEDGWLEGGTGRFSGVVGVEDDNELNVEG